jgi:MIP family channel proteins
MVWRRAAAEALGTFFLVLIGPGAVAVNAFTGGAVTHVGVALAFAFVVCAMVAALGHLSGAHINPGVTLAFWSVRRFAGRDVMPYILAQCFGATAAAALLRAVLGTAGHVGATLPAVGTWPALVVEGLLSFALMFVIMAVATDARATTGGGGGIPPIAIGLTVGFSALMGGPLTGASMNPARSFGPALVSVVWTAHWVYWVGPFAGMLAAARVYDALRPADLSPWVPPAVPLGLDGPIDRRRAAAAADVRFNKA